MNTHRQPTKNKTAITHRSCPWWASELCWLSYFDRRDIFTTYLYTITPHHQFLGQRNHVSIKSACVCAFVCEPLHVPNEMREIKSVFAQKHRSSAFFPLSHMKTGNNLYSSNVWFVCECVCCHKETKRIFPQWDSENFNRLKFIWIFWSWGP